MAERTPAARGLQLAWPFVYGVVAAALFAFVIYPRQGVVDQGVVDLNGFGQIMHNLAEGRGFSFNHGPTMRRAPLYPLIGAALLKLFSDPTTTPDFAYYKPILVANCVFFGLSSVVIRFLTESLFSARAAVLAVLVCPFIPHTLRYVGMTEVETLMGLLILLVAAAGRAFVARPDLRSALFFGVAAALATLAKPVILLYPFVFVPIAFVQWKKNGRWPLRQQLLASGVTLICFVALLLPWSLRNRALTDGKFSGISSNAPGEFLRGYINAQPKYYLLKQDFGGNESKAEKWDPEANAFEDGIFKARGAILYRHRTDSSGHAIIEPTPPPGMTNPLIEAGKDSVEGAEAKERVLRDPGAFVHKFVVQIFTFWYIVETRVKSLLVGVIALFTLILSGIGFWHAERCGRLAWPVLCLVVYVNLLYAALLAFARYSMPLYPTLAVLAAGGALVVAERIPGLRRLASGANEQARPV